MEKNPVTGTFELAPASNLPTAPPKPAKQPSGLKGGYGEMAKIMLDKLFEYDMDPNAVPNIFGYDVICDIGGPYEGPYGLEIDFGSCGAFATLSAPPFTGTEKRALFYGLKPPSINPKDTRILQRRGTTVGAQPVTWPGRRMPLRQDRLDAVKIQRKEAERLAEQAKREMRRMMGEAGWKYWSYILNNMLNMHLGATDAPLSPPLEFPATEPTTTTEPSSGAEAHPSPGDPGVPSPSPRPPDAPPSIELYPDAGPFDPDPKPNRVRIGKEVKMRNPYYKLLKHGVGPLTETGDALKCAWKALPKSAQEHKVQHPRYYDPKQGKWVTRTLVDDKGRPITTPRPQDMARDVFNGWGKGTADENRESVSKLVACLMSDMFTDAVIGRTAQKANSAFVKNIGNRPFGLGSGPAL